MNLLLALVLAQSGLNPSTSSGGGVSNAELRAAPIFVIVDGGTISVNNFPATQTVSGPLTNAELRAAPTFVIVDGGSISVANFPATQAVSGPLTNTELRASPLFTIVDGGSISVAAFPDNEPFNVAQINGVTPLMGSGATGTGSLRVTAATDSPTFGTANGTIPTQSVLTSTRATTYGSSPTAVTAGNNGPVIGDLEGRPYVNTAHPRAIVCNLSTTATTSTQVTGCELVASNSIYITSLTVGGGVATGATAPAIIQSGTSTACTGPVVLYRCGHVAQDTCTIDFPTPIKATAGHGLCLLDATVGTKWVTITGYVAP